MTEAATVMTPSLERDPGVAGIARPLWWGALLTVVLGLARIVSGYEAVSVTFDEPAHIAAGMQLLDKAEFTYERLHPPLSRIAVALGPYIAGYRSQNGGDMWIEGRRIFYGTGAHPETELLVLARLGVLPFFVIGLAAIWVWTSRFVGPTHAALAVILLGNLPVFLAHFGLATTDGVFTATFVAAFFSFLLWLERPTIPRGLALGVAFALAVSTKLSALLFLPAACGAILAHRFICDRQSWSVREFLTAWRGWLVSLAAFLLTIWVVYGCNANPLYGVISLARGVGELAGFARDGDPSYLLGEIRDHGSWAFFPVLLLVKSPIPFLAAFVIGAWTLLHAHWRDWRRMAPLVAAAGIVASVIPSPINIGLRHILPAVTLMAIVAAIGLARLLAARYRARSCAALAGVLLTWQIAEAAVAYPDYLAYFNELAGSDPQRIVVGSDLDWGQDADRLAEALKERRISKVHLAIHTSADLRRHNFPPFTTMYPGRPATGWVAISEQVRAFYCAGYRWLDAYNPVARIGHSIALYYIPGAGEPEDAAPPSNEFNWSVPEPCTRQVS
jgi:hypothetical protein